MELTNDGMDKMEYVSKEEYQDAIANLHTQQILGFCLLGVVLLLVILIGIGCICFLLLKLRQHDRDILQLLEVETGNTTIEKSRAISTDSTIELKEVCVGESSRNHKNVRDSRPLSDLSEVSNDGVSTQPQLVIKIRKEEANVYGRKPPMSQVMMAAQDYYKAQAKTDMVVPAENVQVVNKDTNTRAVQSRIFTEDWKEGTPTSLLFEGKTLSFDDVISHNKGIFVHKTIGQLGGRLEISGVCLEIPPDALTEPTLITLGVLWDEQFQPVLTKKQSLLSPIVLCQPSGTSFKVPVALSFPHAAVNMKEDWIPKLIKREGKLSEASDWTNITLGDIDERILAESRVNLKIKHFTLYTCCGESKPEKMAAKAVNLVALAGRLSKGSFFKPRIYCFNDYKELDEINMMSRAVNPASRVVETSALIVHDNDNDISVELAKLSDGWNVAGDKIEKLPFELVWHACHPHCTFVLKPTTSSIPEVICEFHTYQNGNENTFSKLKIAERLELSSSPLSSTTDDPQEELINELVILLDPENATGSDAGDWKTLAEKMGCGLPRIRWIGTQKNPTQVLIEKWIEDNKTFEELEELMIEINRPDAAEEIRKRLPDLDMCMSAD